MFLSLAFPSSADNLCFAPLHRHYLDSFVSQNCCEISPTPYSSQLKVLSFPSPISLAPHPLPPTLVTLLTDSWIPRGVLCALCLRLFLPFKSGVVNSQLGVLRQFLQPQ